MVFGFREQKGEMRDTWDEGVGGRFFFLFVIFGRVLGLCPFGFVL